MSVPFIANEGQTAAAVAYYAPTFAGTVFVTRDGQIVYSLPGKGAGQEEKSPGGRPAAALAGWSLTEAPVGATDRARPVARKPAQTQVSYFLGDDRSTWTRGISTYEEVSLGQVWPGVTVTLRAHGKNVEKVFAVEPGGDPSRIRMRLSGARSLGTDGAGGLIASTGPGDVRWTPPAAYQEKDGARRPITVAYETRGDSYGFQLGGFDPKLPLVIDPLLQATYLGGSGSDTSQTFAIHPASGDVYVAGTTASTNFPGTTGGARPVSGGGSYDAFVARLTADLGTLTQATYLGGSGDDFAYALAIHPASGDVYVAGITSSTNFPATSGGAQATFGGGGGDGFVARLTPDLKTLTQATYLGGSGHELAYVVAIHPTTGDVYVAGSTDSANFPRTTGGAQALFAGGFFDAFIARLTADLKTLAQATFLGTPGEERVYALAVHPLSGDVYAAGYTSSTNFNGGTSDAFVARLNAGLTTLIRATLLGGNGDDTAYALTIPPSGDVYAAGNTTSTNFPGTTGSAQAAFGGASDAFVARLTADLTTLTRATYVGGSSTDVAQALRIHPASGDVYVSGTTASTNFPGTTGSAQAANGGGNDAFLARLHADLTTLTRATYLGGSGVEGGYALAIHPTSGEVYVGGYTTSTNFPGTTGGARPANGGGNDAFVARLTPDLAMVAPPTGTAFYAVTPCRLVDTRNPAGPLGGPALAAGAQRTFPLTGTCGVPAGARALSLNVTVTSPASAGNLKLFASGTSVPVATVISYHAGQTRANNAIAAPSAAGSLAVFCNQPSGTVQLILDVNGYFQ